LTKFVMNGDFDKVSGMLKDAFEANEANFNATLEAMFGAPQVKAAPPSPPRAPAAPAKTRNPSEGWALGTNRKHSSYGRLRPTSR
jgi:hypothetical protein